jgi:hypothetical protein
MESKRTSIIMQQIVSRLSFNPHLLNYHTSSIEHMPTAENASGYSAPGKSSQGRASIYGILIFAAANIMGECAFYS